MHCHVEYHGSAGMSVVFQVGDLEQIPTAPKRMRHCGDFEYSEEEYYASMNNGNDSSVPSTHPDHPQRGECEYWLWYITCARYPTGLPSDMSMIHDIKTEYGDIPESKVHGAHLGPVGPRWAPCWPHEPCYQGLFGDNGDVITACGSAGHSV